MNIFIIISVMYRYFAQCLGPHAPRVTALGVYATRKHLVNIQQLLVITISIIMHRPSDDRTINQQSTRTSPLLSVIFEDTNSLNSADVPLSNKQNKIFQDLPVTHPRTNRGQRCLTSVARSPKLSNVDLG